MTEKLWQTSIIHPNTKWGLMVGTINTELQKLQEQNCEIISVTIFQEKHLDNPSCLIVWRVTLRESQQKTEEKP